MIGELRLAQIYKIYIGETVRDHSRFCGEMKYSVLHLQISHKHIIR